MGVRARADAALVTGLHPIRRIVPFLMPARNGAWVLFEQTIEAAPAKRFLDTVNARRAPDRPITIFHLVLRVLGLEFNEWPRLNRFTAGSRIYQREGIWLSFSAKTRLERDAPIFTKKIRFEPEEPLVAMVDRIYAALTEGRTGRESATDREVKLFLRLPAPLLRLGVRLTRWLDGRGLLPAKFIENDPLFASAFVANLGSVGLDTAYHHLYEYGSIPIFVVIGRLHLAPRVRPDGTVAATEVFQLRYTYDERIEDGFYAARALERIHYLLEHPEHMAGEGSTVLERGVSGVAAGSFRGGEASRQPPGLD
jgi:hypothetical protein